jgi:hypothetical protein
MYRSIMLTCISRLSVLERYYGVEFQLRRMYIFFFSLATVHSDNWVPALVIKCFALKKAAPPAKH